MRLTIEEIERWHGREAAERVRAAAGVARQWRGTLHELMVLLGMPDSSNGGRPKKRAKRRRGGGKRRDKAQFPPTKRILEAYNGNVPPSFLKGYFYCRTCQTRLHSYAHVRMHRERGHHVVERTVPTRRMNKGMKDVN